MTIAPEDVEQLKGVFVTHERMHSILVEQGKATVEIMRPELTLINKNLVKIDRRCRKRAKTCPGMNLDEMLEMKRKIREFKQEETKDELLAKGELETTQAENFTKKYKAWIIGIGALVVTVVVTAAGILIAVKGG